MTERKTAFVTGASRGIGKVVALYLAKAGYDIAITARSVRPGEQREHSPIAGKSDNTPIAGSLEETAAQIEALGRQVLLLPADITDPATVSRAATIALERWGHIDVLVNCARHIGPGHMDQVLDTPIPALKATMEGNFFTPVLLTQLFLPKMVERKSGVIVNFTSTSGYSSPDKPAGSGGWGLTYGATKAAVHRIAGILAAEVGQHGVLCFNLDPGYTWTERIEQDMAKFGFKADGAPPEVSGAVIEWLVTNPEAKQHNGRTIFAQIFCAERGLLPSWDHEPAFAKMRELTFAFDSAGVDSKAMKAISDG